MGYILNISKPSKAMQLARQFVNSALDTGDLAGIVTECMKPEQHNALYSAVSDDYMDKQKRIREIEAQLGALGKEAAVLMREYSNLLVDEMATREIAHFQLGYCAALRLFGHPPLTVVDGDKTAQ